MMTDWHKAIIVSTCKDQISNTSELSKIHDRAITLLIIFNFIYDFFFFFFASPSRQAPLLVALYYSTKLICQMRGSNGIKLSALRGTIMKLV